jgi:hypothetical protein
MKLFYSILLLFTLQIVSSIKISNIIGKSTKSRKKTKPKVIYQPPLSHHQSLIVERPTRIYNDSSGLSTPALKSEEAKVTTLTSPEITVPSTMTELREKRVEKFEPKAGGAVMKAPIKESVREAMHDTLMKKLDTKEKLEDSLARAEFLRDERLTREAFKKLKENPRTIKKIEPYYESRVYSPYVERAPEIELYETSETFTNPHTIFNSSENFNNSVENFRKMEDEDLYS